MTTSQQDMRAEFKKQFPIPKYINRLMVRHNYAQASAGWDAAWQHRQQELDAARLEVERLYTAIKKITKLNAIDAGIYTTGKIDAICKEALAAQQEESPPPSNDGSKWGNSKFGCADDAAQQGKA